MARWVLTLRCTDRPGIVRATAEGIVLVGGNILENNQFTDPATSLFCMRTAFECEEGDAGRVRGAIGGAVGDYQPVIGLRPEGQLPRVLVMVSRLDHCLVDLLYRQRLGELPAEIAMVVSNHATCGAVAARYGVPFQLVPVAPGAKETAEDRLLAIIDDLAVDVVVLARYMQVLSPRVCDALAGRIINIHHSFLPGFKGAKPYHQAWQRGVKLVGATAHYVTADLDDGPIIDQDVVRVSHASTPEDLVRMGRDVERTVLARALRLHVEDRVAIVGQRTVVFGH